MATPPYALHSESDLRLGGSVTVDVMGRVATLRLAAAPGSRRAKAPTNHGARCPIERRASTRNRDVPGVPRWLSIAPVSLCMTCGRRRADVDVPVQY